MLPGNNDKMIQKALSGGKRNQGVDRVGKPEQPLVSIITVVYNGEKYLQDAIDSVVSQSYSNIEYIIVDAQSDDGTVDIIKKNEKDIDCWISEPDKGIYDGMNKGIALCGGDIIGILNSDDYYENDAIAKITDDFLSDKELMLVYGNINNIDSNARIESVYGSKEKIKDYLATPFNHPACFFKREVYEKIGKFDLSFKTASDYDFMLRFKKTGMPYKYIDEPITNFRKVGVTGKSKWFPAGQIFRLLRKNGYSYSISVFALSYRMGTVVLSIVLPRSVKKILAKYVPYKRT